MAETLKAFLAELALPQPWIPAALQPDVRQLSEWVWGTRDNPGSLYNFYPWVQEAATETVGDYLLFGQDGHGMHSYALHYYLVQGALALFVQMAWGGAYGDREVETIAFGRQMALAQELGEAVQQRIWQPGKRLIVALSDMNGARWGILPHAFSAHQFLDYGGWETSNKVDLQAVLDWLEKQPE